MVEDTRLENARRKEDARLMEEKMVLENARLREENRFMKEEMKCLSEILGTCASTRCSSPSLSARPSSDISRQPTAARLWSIEIL